MQEKKKRPRSYGSSEDSKPKRKNTGIFRGCRKKADKDYMTYKRKWGCKKI